MISFKLIKCQVSSWNSEVQVWFRILIHSWRFGWFLFLFFCNNWLQSWTLLRRKEIWRVQQLVLVGKVLLCFSWQPPRPVYILLFHKIDWKTETASMWSVFSPVIRIVFILFFLHYIMRIFFAIFKLSEKKKRKNHQLMDEIVENVKNILQSS